MSDDPRAVLEAIAYGDHARVTPADRLRALQELGELEATRHACFCEDLAEIDEHELDRGITLCSAANADVVSAILDK